MPCDSVAVVRCRLEVALTTEILTNERAVAGLRAWMAQQFGRATVETKPGEWVVFRPFGFTVSLTQVGLRIEGREGQRHAAKIEAFVRELATASAQDRMARSLKRRYQVTDDQTDARGFRSLTIDVGN